MAFLLYEKENNQLINTRRRYSLAGYNLIYKLWKDKGLPINKEWHMSADELSKIYSNNKSKGKGDKKSYSFLIDFIPNSPTHVGIIELLDIYAYTYADADDNADTETKKNNVLWTPMMLRLQHILHEKCSPAERKTRIEKLEQPSEKKEIIEFLYLQGAGGGWKWSPSGQTNAALIEEPVRTYFRKYF